LICASLTIRCTWGCPWRISHSSH